MKLVKFSVTNFRSIDKAVIPMSDLTVILGKNNEGKSNILTALLIAMNIIKSHSDSNKIYGERRDIRRSRPLRGSKNYYRWERDFPISLQNGNEKKGTEFKLEFELNEDDLAEFSSSIGSNLNGILPIYISISKEGGSKISVKKRGKGNENLNKKSNKISSFIADRILFNHIPAVRTEDHVMEVIDEMVSRELREIEKEKEYVDAVEKIKELQAPVTEKIKDNIQTLLSGFLPGIQKIDLHIDARTALRKYTEMFINDGNPTEIEYKGDGVKSLTAIALLQNRTFESSASIIAIEEPEAHLHSGSMRQLKKVIDSLAEENQIILTTHNPIFVSRDIENSNILIDKGKAEVERDIDRIIDVLGVRPIDNLVNSEFVLLVEGESDLRILKALLSFKSQTIKNAINNRSLSIHSLGGASKLPQLLPLLKAQLCFCYTFLDDDDEANKAIAKSKDRNFLEDRNYSQVTFMDMNESEIEDCIHVEIYKDALESRYNISLTGSEFKNSDYKWSDRMRNLCRRQGKKWNHIEKDAKTIVAECVEKKPTNALNRYRSGPIDALIKTLEKLIKSSD